MITVNPAFSSLSDFIYMGGHGAFVWTAWGISLLCSLILVVFAMRARAHAYAHIHQQAVKSLTLAEEP
jgi:heme exporter protein D